MSFCAPASSLEETFINLLSKSQFTEDWPHNSQAFSSVSLCPFKVYTLTRKLFQVGICTTVRSRESKTESSTEMKLEALVFSASSSS